MTEVRVILTMSTVNLNAKISCNACSRCEPFVFPYILLYFKLTTVTHWIRNLCGWPVAEGTAMAK